MSTDTTTTGTNVDGAGLATSMDLVAQTGVTYRQVDYWCTRGWLRPSNQPRWPGTDPQHPGSGLTRLFTASEVTMCHLMVRLLEAGFRPADAHLWSRSLVDQGYDAKEVNRVLIGEGIWLEVTG